ncbi:MAG: hypothetical protein QXH08_06310 [Candidatus Hadarchaeales archaeon]
MNKKKNGNDEERSLVLSSGKVPVVGETFSTVEGLELVGGFPFPRWRHRGDTGKFVSTLGEEADTLEVVLLAVHPTRVYFEDDFRPGQPNAPRCKSLDGKTSIYGADCSLACPYSEASGPTEKCNLGWEVYFYDVVHQEVYALQLLRTKVAPFVRYLARIRKLGQIYRGLTRISSVRRENYFIPEFELIRPLTPEEVEGTKGKEGEGEGGFRLLAEETKRTIDSLRGYLRFLSSSENGLEDVETTTAKAEVEEEPSPETIFEGEEVDYEVEEEVEAETIEAKAKTKTKAKVEEKKESGSGPLRPVIRQREERPEFDDEGEESLEDDDDLFDF